MVQGCLRVRKRSASLTETKVKDPVCGMTIDSNAARGGSFVYHGVEYFFCSPKCNERFRSAPGEFLSPSYKPTGMMSSSSPLIQPSFAQPSFAQPSFAQPGLGQTIPTKPTTVSPILTQPLRPAANRLSVEQAAGEQAAEEQAERPPSTVHAAPEVIQRISFATSSAVKHFRAKLFSTKRLPTKHSPATDAPAKYSPANDAPAYLCPMCPEVRSAKPEACPSCGMALEPETLQPASRTEYVCPMHPQVVQDHPGSCPICGMALEPRTVSTAHEQSPELIDMTRRLRVSAFFGVPLLLYAMWHMFTAPAHPAPGAENFAAWVEFLLATPVVLWGGLPFFRRAIASVQHRSPNMFTLIGLGVGVSYLYSAIATYWPTLFPPSLRGHGGQPPVYFESAATIIILVLAGQVMELRARGQTSSALRALLDLSPRMARRVEADGREIDVPLGQVQAGNLLRVRPGEKVPVA